MTTKILYPALAGYQTNLPLLPSGADAQGMTPAVAELMNTFERAGVSLRDLQAITIPLVDQSNINRSEDDSIWLPVELLTVDALIDAQTEPDKLWRLTMDSIRSTGRTAIPKVLKAMPTLSHCAALWGWLSLVAAAKPEGSCLAMDEVSEAGQHVA